MVTRAFPVAVYLTLMEILSAFQSGEWKGIIGFRSFCRYAPKCFVRCLTLLRVFAAIPRRRLNTSSKSFVFAFSGRNCFFADSAKFPLRQSWLPFCISLQIEQHHPSRRHLMIRSFYVVPAMFCLAALVTAQAPAEDRPAGNVPAAQQPAAPDPSPQQPTTARP